MDAGFHPTLIRFLAGYLDQGLAQWSMPRRDIGHPWLLPRDVRHGDSGRVRTLGARLSRTSPPTTRAAGRSAIESIAHSLDDLGVDVDERAAFLTAELLALAGWAGMVRQIEERPDRVPARDLVVTLRGYLAVRLLFERAALLEAARRSSSTARWPDSRSWLESRVAGHRRR